MAENINIAGRLHSTATGNVVAGANEILDDAKGKKQSVVNLETEAAIQAEIERATEAENDRYIKSETYNKTELNNMITTPNQGYVSVVATDQTTAATDVLPATGSADTIYRVGNWDGTQFDNSVFSEYAWNGSAYVKLSTKSQVGEVYDISLNHAGATYADLAAALGTNGANIPQSLRKGGMSVKYVQSSDNKYVQYMYNGTSTAVADFTNVANWEKTNLEEEVSQLDQKLIKLVGWDGDISRINITGAGQYYYNSYSHKIWKCKTWNGSVTSSVYVEINPQESALYQFDGRLYIWDGTTLILAASKIITLTGFVTTQGSISVGDTYYNTNAKELRRKTAQYDYEVIPFYDSTIYLYNNDIYVWNGTDLVVKTCVVENSLNSTSEVNALSAAKGKFLNDKIDSVVEEIVSKNLFDKSHQQNIGYIGSDGTTGSTSDTNYGYSYAVPVSPNKYYYLSGRTQGLPSVCVRCLDSQNNPIKVLIASTGEEYSSYNLPNEMGTAIARDGQFKTPSNAVAFQFNYKFNGVGNTDDVMLFEIGSTYIPEYPAPEYESFGNKNIIKETALPEDIRNKDMLSLLKGKKIRIFGGSVSWLSKTWGGDAVMEEMTGCIIQNDGANGGGYAAGTQIIDGQPVFSNESIPHHVDLATASGQTKYDVYVLWSSTNDWSSPVGDATDYTISDSFDVNKLTTQCGGINYCIKKLSEFAPEAHIILLGSMKSFDGDGYTLNSKIKQLVDGQEQVALLQSVPFYSLWANAGVNYANKDTYFTWTVDKEGESRNDGTHPNIWAYQNVLSPKIIKQIGLLF